MSKSLSISLAIIQVQRSFFQSPSFELTEGLVAEETRFFVEGDRWFKKHPFEVDLNLYLLPGHETLYWSKWIHLNNVKEECRHA